MSIRRALETRRHHFHLHRTLALNEFNSPRECVSRKRGRRALMSVPENAPAMPDDDAECGRCVAARARRTDARAHCVRAHCIRIEKWIVNS